MGTHVGEGRDFGRSFEMVETTKLRRRMEDAIDLMIAALDALDIPDEDREDDEREPDIGDEPEGDDADTEPCCEDEGACESQNREPDLGWLDWVNQCGAIAQGCAIHEEDVTGPEAEAVPLHGLGMETRAEVRALHDPRLNLRPVSRGWNGYLSAAPRVPRFPYAPDVPAKHRSDLLAAADIFATRALRKKRRAARAARRRS